MFKNLLTTILLLGALILIYLYRVKIITYLRAILAGVPLRGIAFPTASGGAPTLNTNCSGGDSIKDKAKFLELQKNAIGAPNFECKQAPFVWKGYGVWSLQPVKSVPTELLAYYVQHPRNGLFYPEINLIQKFYPANGKKRKWYYDYVYDYVGTFPEVNLFTDRTSIGFTLGDNANYGNTAWEVLYNNSYRVNKSLKGFKNSPGFPFVPKHVYDPIIKYANNYLGAAIFSTGDIWKVQNTQALERFTPTTIVLPKGSGGILASGTNCENFVFFNEFYRESPFGELFWKNTIPLLQGKSLYGACFNSPTDLLKENLQGQTLMGLYGTPAPVTIGGYLFSTNQATNKGFYDYPVIVRADSKQGGKIDQYFYS